MAKDDKLRRIPVPKERKDITTPWDETYGSSQLGKILRGAESVDFLDWYHQHWKEKGYVKYRRQPPRFLFDDHTIWTMIYDSEGYLYKMYLEYGYNFFNDQYEFLANVLYDNWGKRVHPSRIEDYMELMQG